jgi:hypothetical protein
VFISKNQLNLQNKFRLLWEQHDVWTREVINGIVFELPNLDLTIARLLRNPTDMGRLFGFFYGPNVKINIEELFTAHLTIAAELVQAAKEGNDAAVQDARTRWYENAKDIAKYLSSINPFWNYNEWLELLNHHLGLVENEAVSLLMGNYEENIAIYDEIERQSLVMADLMAHGIIDQFSIK